MCVFQVVMLQPGHVSLLALFVLSAAVSAVAHESPKSVYQFIMRFECVSNAFSKTTVTAQL